jgi:protein Mpv17
MITQSVIFKAVVVLTAALNGDNVPKKGIFNKLPFIPNQNLNRPSELPAPIMAPTDTSANQKQLAVVNTCRGGQEEKVSILKRHPFTAAVGITTFNAFAADLMTQLIFEKNPWNPQRSAVFAAFGFLYQGMAQYAIVNLGWEKLFPGTKPKAVISKICAMNLLSDPLLFMPTFYIFKEVMGQGGLTLPTVKAALWGYKANCFMDWRNSWMVWFPGHAVTYGVMPPHKRIPWMAFLSFFYMIVLSITRGGS